MVAQAEWVKAFESKLLALRPHRDWGTVRVVSTSAWYLYRDQDPVAAAESWCASVAPAPVPPPAIPKRLSSPQLSTKCRSERAARARSRPRRRRLLRRPTHPDAGNRLEAWSAAPAASLRTHHIGGVRTDESACKALPDKTSVPTGHWCQQVA